MLTPVSARVVKGDGERRDEVGEWGGGGGGGEGGFLRNMLETPRDLSVKRAVFFDKVRQLSQDYQRSVCVCCYRMSEAESER